MIDNFAERLGRGGEILLKIINGIFGLIWTIATIFVVPVMVYEDLGPVAAIKESIATLKKTWGESLIRYYGVGLVQFIFILLGVILAIGLALLAVAITPYALIAVGMLLFIYFLSVILFFSVANSIFNVALYAYANKKKLPRGYTHEIMSNAFKHT